MREIQYREAIVEAISEEMDLDKKVLLMGEEVAEYNGAYKASKGLLEKFGPDRVIDTPISELGFSGIGVGAAMNGLRPIIEFMTFNFSLVGIDQIINNAAKMMQMSGGQFNIPIVFRGPTGSAGQLGATHSQSFDSWYANCPGLKVVVPSNPYDAKGLLKSSIRDNDPVIFMESELMYGDKGLVPEDEYLIPIGKSNIVKEGKDVTIVSYGKMMKVVLEAWLHFTKKNISCEVIDLRTIRPLDFLAIVNSVKKTNRLIIVEESWPFGSISSEISYRIQKDAFDFLDAPIGRVCSADVPMAYAPNLVQEFLPSVNKIIEKVNQVMCVD
jgi:pyruvate dehydrogenase E1 component beta subunit